MRLCRREAGFFLLTALSIVPLWIVKRPPSQDWPQHVAAVRVLIDHAVPALRLADAVQIDLARTQYVGFYLLAALIAQGIGAASAVKLLMSCTLIAIPYGLRALLRASGGDERYAPFAVVLTYTAHVLLGFLSFLAAVPLALFALHAAIRYRVRPSLRHGVWLSLWLVALFFMHVLPFVFALLGAVLILAGCERPALRGAGLALLPSMSLAALWASLSPAGGSTAVLVRDALLHRSSSATQFDSPRRTLLEFPEWLTDVLPGPWDVIVLSAACVVLLVFGLLFQDRALARARSVPHSVRFVMVMPLFALVCAFVLPNHHGWIWPVASRFPYLFVLLFPLLLPRMQKRAGDVCAIVLGVLALAHVGLIARAFDRIEKTEMRGFEAALALIPEGSRVLGLMYYMTSKHVLTHVFMHAHAHVQADHGGVLMYSFAMTPQSPFVYVDPPAGPPALRQGLGWSPHLTDMNLASEYFEYAIAHGYHEHLAMVRRYYEPIYDENGWSVYRRY
ncbi:MAG: hypothetical protein JWN04_1530 [Myxococcaceae bacterium]|nr:hypothetical protein [Myxococcaceae bacterium]